MQSGRRPFLDYGQFYDAITRGDIDKVKAMLDAGANIERERDDGGTPLLIAIYKHHVDIVKLLLERGSDVNSPVIDSPPIFHAATRSEHAPELIQVLLDHGADLEATASDTHLSVLHWAVGNNTLHATDFLISKGADINRTCMTGKTPLLFAAEKGHTEMVRLLHAKGSDIHVHSRNGGTPLMWASSCGHADTVRFLLEKGARVEDYDDEGMSKSTSFVQVLHIVTDTSQLPLQSPAARASWRLSKCCLKRGPMSTRSARNQASVVRRRGPHSQVTAKCSRH